MSVSEQSADPVEELRRERERQREAEELERELADIDAEREEQEAEEKHARLKQYVLDRRRQKELEAKHGFSRILAVPFTSWKPDVGAATMFVVLLPTAHSALYKRMQRGLARSKDDLEQQLVIVEDFARSCVCYPNPENTAERKTYQATLNLASAALGNLADQIIAAVQGKDKQEKKG